MECVLPYDKVDEALKFLCLQGVPVGSTDERSNVDNDGKARDAVEAGKCLQFIPSQNTLSTVGVA